MVKTWSITREDVDIGSQHHEPDLTSLQGSEIPPIHFPFCMQMSMQTRLPKCKSTQVNSCFKLLNALPLQEAYKGPPWAGLCFLPSTPLSSRAITQVVPCPCNSPVSASPLTASSSFRPPFTQNLFWWASPYSPRLSQEPSLKQTELHLIAALPPDCRCPVMCLSPTRLRTRKGRDHVC